MTMDLDIQYYIFILSQVKHLSPGNAIYYRSLICPIAWKLTSVYSTRPRLTCRWTKLFPALECVAGTNIISKCFLSIFFLSYTLCQEQFTIAIGQPKWVRSYSSVILLYWSGPTAPPPPPKAGLFIITPSMNVPLPPLTIPWIVSSPRDKG